MSSALPDDLRSFTSEERGATDEIRNTPATLGGLVETFQETCKWGTLDCSQVLVGFANYITANDEDCTRTDIVASNFEAAGGSGTISTVSDAAITASLEANGMSLHRPQLEIPAVEATGNLPTSGYANDPVNTATGNFVKNEEDLRYEGGTALLGWTRSYSSLSQKVGGHGPGWASFDGCGLRFDDDGASWTLLDGREVVFPRMGDGFDRAAHESFWLSVAEDGCVITNSAGARWEFTPQGRPTSFTLTDGATITFDYDADRLVRIRHVRGHEIGVEWDGDRIAAVQADDGRRVVYRYEEGRLVEVAGPLGSRRYEWDEDGLISAVIDADGVVEARNTYDDQGRVSTQTSPFGRVTRFAYLSGRVTAVSDMDGGRSNTWVADARGRLLRATSDRESVTYTYDRSGRRTGEEHSDGRRRELEWGPLWTLASVTDHHHDRVVRTTTTVDALGRLARVNSERVFFDDVSGGLLQTGRDCVVRAGPLTAHARTGWLGASWRPERPTDPADPYRPPAPQATTGPIGIGAGGEVRVAGLEWTGARVLDPATSGFLSPDPMEPTTGAGWTGNPYSYAGNNPANLLDPTGLHPVYAAELDEYRKANSPKWGTALAIAAGVGLAFVPGAQGLGAALIAGAVLGGGASLIDQLCTGYPVNWGKVGTDTLMGMAGGAAGYGAGKAFQWASRTKAGQRAIGWVQDQAGKIPVVRNIAKYVGARGSDGTQRVNLASRQRTKHILDSDHNGGGHRWPGKPGKTPYPRSWSDEEIMETVSDIATDPSITWKQKGGRPGATTYKRSGNPVRYTAIDTREGLNIKVIVEPGGQGIITGYPTQWPELGSPLSRTVRNEFALWTPSWGNDITGDN